MSSTTKSVFDVIRKQHITEKSSLVNSVDGGVVFEVHPDSNKVQIRKAVEKIFDVKVKSVRVLNATGKLKRVGRRVGAQRKWKKAYVSLKEGSVDLIEGL